MVSRPATDRQILDLQNAESATAWIMSFVAKCRAEKKEDKVNTDGTVQDLQVTNLFLSTINRVTFAMKKNVSSEQASPASEMGMFFTKEQIFSMSVTWEYISINNCKVKMQVDTGADSTVISSKIWTELGKPQLVGKIRHLEAYDGHQLTLLGSLTCDVEWNGSRLTKNNLQLCSLIKNLDYLVETFYPSTA